MGILPFFLPLVFLCVFAPGCVKEPPPPTVETDIEVFHQALNEAQSRVQEETQRDRESEVQVRLVFDKFRALLIQCRPVPEENENNLAKAKKFMDLGESLDISECPGNYREAHENLIAAWTAYYEELIKNGGDLKKDPNSPEKPEDGNYTDLSTTYDGIPDDDPDYKIALDTVREKTKTYVEVIRKYSIFAP